MAADDFTLSIDGTGARIETATWVGERDIDSDRSPALEGPPSPGPGALTDPGRLIVFLFQKDLEPSLIIGLMQMLLRGRHLLDTLAPNDRLAMLSLDSHLEIGRTSPTTVIASIMCLPTACCSSGHRQHRRLRCLHWSGAWIQTRGDEPTVSSVRLTGRRGARTVAWSEIARSDRLRVRKIQPSRCDDGK